MKVFLGIAAVLLACMGILWLVPGNAPVRAAQLTGAQQSGSVITCSSDDMRRHYCAADVSGGAQLVRQRSEAPCIFGQTWGYASGRGIWVDRGCRGDFQTTANWSGWDNNYNIYCASDNGKRNWCPTDTRNGVQMVRQRSGSPCVFERSWGYDRRGVWVDRGCRADFQIGGNNWQPGAGGTQVINCSSDDMRRHVCPVNTGGDVRLIRQRSEADCVYNSTWGFDVQGIWVDRGCRADFLIGSNYGQPGGGGQQTVTCSSDDMNRNVCPADTSGGVQLIRQFSSADCDFNSTWGYDAQGIWVDRGCRAEFRLGGSYGQQTSGAQQTITCSSDDMHRNFCSVNTRGGVRLVHQRSEAPCVLNQTWGYNAQGIWVDRGCRADFAVGGSYY